ncbi:endo alpha-1,4 polygalactosaminidase [Actinocrispum wychmicini]|uniref:endo alpha-1,4 polygalactosaminidase n=1 Tax=Actinocrispum wychmicini TaxID=1213861 RepID=UPI00140468A2|nr:endo alpha-1,4 polygalactosaminidase [Actinocrispum wychmicini]
MAVLVAGCSGTNVPVPDRPANGWWRPHPGVRWQYQLVPTTRTGPGIVNGINLRPDEVCTPPPKGAGPVCPDVYGIDLWVDSQVTGSATDVVNTEAVKAIHSLSAHAICYFSGGTLEAWRPDARKILDWDAAHPEAHLVSKALAPPYDNERWFNVKPGAGRLEFLTEIMAARMKLCADNGFDAVDPDWPDAWLHNSEAGWSEPVTAADQLGYNRMLAGAAHRLGLGIVLKNDSKQAPDLVGDFDLAVIEDCQWTGADIQPCDPLTAFTAAGKPVLHVEYLESDEDPPERNPLGTPAAICAAATPGFDTIVKKASKTLNDLPWTPCR